MDGDTSASATTVVDADRVVFNDDGTMKQVAVTDLAAYFDDEITAMPNLVTTAATTVGALNSGSITSGFGTIDTGSSTITTTGLISGGSLDIDDVVINGSTIGHTDDTDLMTVASGVLTVAGEVSMTTLDIGGTNVTSTAAELNYSDTGAAVGTVVASKVVTADANKDVASFRNITLTGELDAGSLDVSGDADIDGTLEADAITIDGTALATVIAGTTITNATNSAHVLVTDNESTNEENLITFVEGATSSTGNVGLEMDGNFAYNPSTGTVSATIFKGNIDAVDGDFDGTLEADAITIGGTAIDSVLSPVAGSGSIVTTGALNSGSITSGFGAIDNGASAITTTGVITGGTLEATTDTAAGDNAAIGYTAAEGLILTGQGSTSDVTIKNDADADVLSIATGTTILTVSNDVNVVGRATGTVTTDNDGVFDISVSNNFLCTPSGDFTLTFNNPAAGQSGNVLLINSGGHTVSAHASVAINAAALTAIATAGTYHLTYYCSAASGNNTIAVSASGALA
jgi:hypothetical protein